MLVQPQSFKFHAYTWEEFVNEIQDPNRSFLPQFAVFQEHFVARNQTWTGYIIDGDVTKGVMDEDSILIVDNDRNLVRVVNAEEFWKHYEKVEPKFL